MNIALIGYGKMGQAIERLALSRGHQITTRITAENRAAFEAPEFAAADVAIEFTGPDAAAENALTCLEKNVPVVSGSTGWNARIPEVQAVCNRVGGTMLQSSNFSIGVQLFFLLNQKLAQLMATHPEYALKVSETHHTEKKDAPSGTAVTLTEGILNETDTYQNWHLGTDSKAGSIPVEALRIEGIPGTHQVRYTSAIDTIEIAHTAHSRDGFALGAVLAAEFLAGKKGVFTMQDVLNS
ncbi:MAG: 4-hydroxy-tetrahydrodipicolinate reductase [Sphingobacteriales bacterium]|nr:MAG: 4-hydroxy-tetrahydrodipicolinate reductase [Sphingobacteriales bacterium]